MSDTMKFPIPSRYSAHPVYVATIPTDTPSHLRMRAAVEAAIKAMANLCGANLYGAKLCGANLDGANLSGAYLDGAYLYGANLYGANLCGANLDGAYLCGANLCGANLCGASFTGASFTGANLAGADLSRATLLTSGGATLALVGDRPILMIGPLGSRQDYLTVYLTDGGMYVRTGCFFGALDTFAAAVESDHGDGPHGREYRAAVAMIRAHAEIWMPALARGDAE